MSEDEVGEVLVLNHNGRKGMEGESEEKDQRMDRFLTVSGRNSGPQGESKV